MDKKVSPSTSLLLRAIEINKFAEFIEIHLRKKTMNNQKNIMLNNESKQEFSLLEA